jgi:hypothetical protein
MICSTEIQANRVPDPERMHLPASATGARVRLRFQEAYEHEIVWTGAIETAAIKAAQRHPPSPRPVPDTMAETLRRNGRPVLAFPLRIVPAGSPPPATEIGRLMSTRKTNDWSVEELCFRTGYPERDVDRALLVLQRRGDIVTSSAGYRWLPQAKEAS